MAALQSCSILSLIFSNLVPLILQSSECNETFKDWIVTNGQKCIAAFHPQPCKAALLLNENIYQKFIYIYIKCGTKLIFVLRTKTSPVPQKSPHQLHFMATLRAFDEYIVDILESRAEFCDCQLQGYIAPLVLPGYNL